MNEIRREYRLRFRKLAQDLVQLTRAIRSECPTAEVFMEAEAGLFLACGPVSGDGVTRAESDANKVEGGYWTPGFGCGAF